jgi:antitoxin CcdA
MRMKNERVAAESRRRTVATNISLDSALVAEARALGVNISRASALGLEKAVAQARADQWLKENELALESSNEFVNLCGLPLRDFRQF